MDHLLNATKEFKNLKKQKMLLIILMVKKLIELESQYFPKPYEPFGRDMKMSKLIHLIMQ